MLRRPTLLPQPGWRCACLLLLVAGCNCAIPGWAPPANKSEWRSRTIYQVLVDRFDLGSPTDTRCLNFNQYCGGLWKGLTSQIPYIKDMGFDAIWFTPINAQTGGRTWQYPDGYHGYWPRDLWSLNDQFGTAAELEQMVDAMHAAGIWAMLDVVPNHVGYGAMSDIAVFNQSDYYHSCDGCQIGCSYSNANDQQVRQCRLSNLPDLDQDHPYVSSQLMSWHNNAYKQWQIDGYRVDAAKHVNIPWLHDLRNNVSIFTIGEYITNIDIIFSRLKAGALDSALNFYLVGSLTGAFTLGKMQALKDGILQLRQLFGPNSTLPGVLPLLGNYLENHDNERFLCDHDDIRMYENSHAFILFAEGIPIVYYGAELALRGVRDPLWPTKYGRYQAKGKDYKNFEMYKFLKIMIAVRKARQVWDYPMNILNVTGPLADNIFAIERGGVVLILNNFDKSMEGYLSREPVQIQISGLGPALRNLVLSNPLFPYRETPPGSGNMVTDRVSVDGQGVMTFSPSPHRWPLVYIVPTTNLQAEPIGAGMDPFIPYVGRASGLGPDGIALVVLWAFSATVAVLFHLGLRGWFAWTQPWINKRLGRTASGSPPVPVMLTNMAADALATSPGSKGGADTNGKAASRAAAVKVMLDNIQGEPHTTTTTFYVDGTNVQTGDDEVAGKGKGVQQPDKQADIKPAVGTKPEELTRAGVSEMMLGLLTSKPAASTPTSAVPTSQADVSGNQTDHVGQQGSVSLQQVVLHPTSTSAAQPSSHDSAGAANGSSGAQAGAGDVVPSGSVPSVDLASALAAGTDLTLPTAEGPSLVLSTSPDVKIEHQRSAGHQRMRSWFEGEQGLQAASAVLAETGRLPIPLSPADLGATESQQIEPGAVRQGAASEALHNSHAEVLIDELLTSPSALCLSPAALALMPSRSLYFPSRFVNQSSNQTSPTMARTPGTMFSPGRLLTSTLSGKRSYNARGSRSVPAARQVSLTGSNPSFTANQLNVLVEGAEGGGDDPASARDSPTPHPGARDLQSQATQSLNSRRASRPTAQSLISDGVRSRRASADPRMSVSSSNGLLHGAVTSPPGLPGGAFPPPQLITDPALSVHDGGSIMVDEAEMMEAFATGYQVPDDLVLHVAMEYSVPHTGLEFMFGGLGKVVDIFLRYWPGPIGLCAPLYASAYNDHEKDLVPKFLPPDTRPSMCTVRVSRDRPPLAVDIFVLEQDNVVYFLIQADIFKHRSQKNIYSFQDEDEMLTWVSIMTQATATVISQFNVKKVQFHDWHGTLALHHLPDQSLPAVMVVLHNAHYNGKFKVPDTQRRVYVYSMFDLDTTLFTHLLEYQGCVNMLHGIVNYLKLHQYGEGMVAVSPRYAELVLHKLDVMWQMRSERKVVGILNALPFIDCLASEMIEKKMTIQEVIRYKAERKIEFQKQYGLNVSDASTLDQPFSGPQLVISLGRMTHQKGSDIIALAADAFLAACPRCQLVMVGPSGDKTGTEAQILLSKVAEKYPGRVYAPENKYFGPTEKKLLYDAADFCLMPSRFEPCGLVDIECGWNGAVCIGHNTGGLGKMPGVYYEVQTSARRHLAAKLSKAVMDAMDIPADKRLDLLQQALATRFPVEEMMAKYQKQWEGISAACKRQHDEKAKLASLAQNRVEQELYFDKLWKRQNKTDVVSAKQAEVYDRGRVLKFIRSLFGVDVGRHDISFRLLLFLEALCKLPAFMVNGFAVQVYLGYTTITSCQSQWDASWKVFPDLLNDLSFRILLSYGIYTIAAPCWMIIAMKMQPKRYIIGLVWATALSAIMAHACMYWTVLINPTVIITSIMSPMGVALLPMNFLGKDVEVSETGFKYMIVVEVGTSLFMFAAALLAALSRNNLAFIIVNGFTVLAALLYLAWFTAPDVLHHAFAKERFTFKDQWNHILRIASFWLTSLVMVCENVALVLTAYSTLLNFSLVLLMQLIAVVFGARVLSLFTTYLIMNLNCSQLYVQDIVMAIATLPGFAIAKQLAVDYGNFAGVLSTTAAVEFVFGSRFQLVGLLAFETIPSRELVAVWQLTTMVVSTIVPALVLALGYTTQTNFRNSVGLLIGVCVCEGVRLLAMIALKFVHKKENLSSL